MKCTLLGVIFVFLIPGIGFAQDQTVSRSADFHSSRTPTSTSLPDAPDKGSTAGLSEKTSSASITDPNQTARFRCHDKLRYYLDETFLNPSVITAPAFRAGIRMANPPSAYPSEWRQGAKAFGRNYGDAFAQRISFHTARFLTGTSVGEDPRYFPSSSKNVFARTLHALSFAFVDRSDSGHAMPAISNFAGAAAAGFVGNAYLPDGFANITHAGQRATLQFGFSAAGNLFQEFAPQMPKPLRTIFELIAR